MGDSKANSEFSAPPRRRALSALPVPTYAPTDPIDVSKFTRRQRTFSARVSSNRPSVRVETRTYSPMKVSGPDKWIDYDKPITNREDWWRKDIKDTPRPGQYNLPDFLVEIGKQPSSYRFNAPIRECQLTDTGKSGELLDPYLYAKKSFVSELADKRKTYGFKSTEREEAPKVGYGCPDKHLSNLDPTMYSTASFLPDPKVDCTLSSFKSRTKRKGPFIPKAGPSPAATDLSRPLAKSWHHGGTSSFMSDVPRLSSTRKSGPGPGSYTPTDPNPIPSSILAPRRIRQRSKSAPAISASTSAGRKAAPARRSIKEECGDDEEEEEDGEK